MKKVFLASLLFIAIFIFSNDANATSISSVKKSYFVTINGKVYQMSEQKDINTDEYLFDICIPTYAFTEGYAIYNKYNYDLLNMSKEKYIEFVNIIYNGFNKNNRDNIYYYLTQVLLYRHFYDNKTVYMSDSTGNEHKGYTEILDKIDRSIKDNYEYYQYRTMLIKTPLDFKKANYKIKFNNKDLSLKENNEYFTLTSKIPKEHNINLSIFGKRYYENSKRILLSEINGELEEIGNFKIRSEGIKLDIKMPTNIINKDKYKVTIFQGDKLFDSFYLSEGIKYINQNTLYKMIIYNDKNELFKEISFNTSNEDYIVNLDVPLDETIIEKEDSNEINDEKSIDHQNDEYDKEVPNPQTGIKINYDLILCLFLLINIYIYQKWQLISKK